MIAAHAARECADLFAATLRSSLRYNLAVELRGSWNTLEYHLQDWNGALVSFSDIDCVCDLPNQELACCIEEIVNALPQPFRLPHSSISLRRRNEINSLWRGPNRAELAVEYVNFWTWVSILEGFNFHPIDFANEYLGTYKRCKHILRLWRLAAIVAGRPATNWRDTAKFMSLHAKPDSVDVIYCVKIGSSSILDVSSQIEENENALLKYFQTRHQATLFELDRFGTNLSITGTSNFLVDSRLAETAMSRARVSSACEPNGSLVLARLQQKLDQ